MKFNLFQTMPEQLNSTCLLVGIFDNLELPSYLQALNQQCNNFLEKMVMKGEFLGRPEQTLWLPEIPHMNNVSILLVGLGNRAEFSEFKYLRALQLGALVLKNQRMAHVSSFFTELPLSVRNNQWKIRQQVELIGSVFYVFNQLKSKKESPALKQFNIFMPTDSDDGQRALHEGMAILKGQNLMRDLANNPANICTPTYLAQTALELQESYAEIKVKVLQHAELEELGMNAFLAVAKGSHEKPKFIILEYCFKEGKPIVLVGKGITFDSGGISIKPAQAMDEMKYDMSGAASVLGTFKAVAELKLPVNLVGIIPATENLPGGNATKPGDIVTSLSGQTVEILNTDAEGRLILCDALTYALRYEPEAIIDIATLTGAVVIALGQYATGLLTNNANLGTQIKQAAQESYDRVWELPLWEDYQAGLESNFADMANISSDRGAGSIMGATFLGRFVGKVPWAHLDIAGTAWKTGKEKGSTGRPVALLVQFLLGEVR